MEAERDVARGGGDDGEDDQRADGGQRARWAGTRPRRWPRPCRPGSAARPGACGRAPPPPRPRSGNTYPPTVSRASQVAADPLAKSRTKAARPAALPTLRMTLVAPTLPLPTARTSTPSMPGDEEAERDRSQQVRARQHRRMHPPPGRHRRESTRGETPRASSTPTPRGATPGSESLPGSVRKSTSRSKRVAPEVEVGQVAQPRRLLPAAQRDVRPEGAALGREAAARRRRARRPPAAPCRIAAGRRPPTARAGGRRPGGKVPRPETVASMGGQRPGGGGSR